MAELEAARADVLLISPPALHAMCDTKSPSRTLVVAAAAVRARPTLRHTRVLVVAAAWLVVRVGASMCVLACLWLLLRGWLLRVGGCRACTFTPHPPSMCATRTTSPDLGAVQRQAGMAARAQVHDVAAVCGQAREPQGRRRHGSSTCPHPSRDVAPTRHATSRLVAVRPPTPVSRPPPRRATRALARTATQR